MTIANEKYVALTTYRRSGESSSAPVWIADLGDGTMGFTTSSGSLKVTRIRNDNRIQLQPCDSRGRITEGTEAVSGTAALVTGAEFDAVRAAIKGKYGWQVTLITAWYKAAKLFGKDQASDTGVVITLD